MGDVCIHSDEKLRQEYGITIAFSERTGGCSVAPYESLNLGLHVKDTLDNVVHNRALLMDALDISPQAQSFLSSAEQVHGTHAVFIEDDASPHVSPYPATDALATNMQDRPLLLCFADCVPIILVSLEPRVVAVIHSGWKGTLLDITGKTIESMIERYGLDPAQLYAYIGPFISEKNFETSHAIASQFVSKFDTLSYVCDDELAPGLKKLSTDSFQTRNSTDVLAGTCRVDLSCAIHESLKILGVKPCHIVSLDVCTVETTDRFFSYRAEHGTTGRHGALAVLT